MPPADDETEQHHGPLARREHQNRLAPVEMTAEERIAELQDAVDDARERVDRNLARIRRDVRELSDVEQWVRNHPWRSVGIAFGLGVYLGFR